MRIAVDLNRCQGYAQCVFLAHDVFRLTGQEALTYEPNPDDERRLQVERAAAACPVPSARRPPSSPWTPMPASWRPPSAWARTRCCSRARRRSRASRT
ncbi:ferredoxin [Streptomyces sioyaensis]|uniref:ferredoxin n=1 Tax=Streptomyces sioyaensis TaxID=67364 RepID=UPI0033F44A08